jgi:hypothetical protein
MMSFMQKITPNCVMSIGESPNIMVDGNVVFRGMPTLFELKKILLDFLKKSYAKGGITENEFEKMKKNIK